MSDSIGEDIQTVVVETVRAVDLPGIPANMARVRMLPRADEALDAVPVVIISEAVEEDIEIVDTEGGVEVVYAFEISIVTMANKDHLANTKMGRNRRQRIRRAFGWDTDDRVPTVFRVNVSARPLFDHSELNQNYLYSSIVVRFWSYEQRSS